MVGGDMVGVEGALSRFDGGFAPLEAERDECK
jgi:hypothetical protein